MYEDFTTFELTVNLKEKPNTFEKNKNNKKLRLEQGIQWDIYIYFSLTLVSLGMLIYFIGTYIYTETGFVVSLQLNTAKGSRSAAPMEFHVPLVDI